MGIKEFKEKDYMLKSLESISHGYVGHVGWDLVILAESLELPPCQAVEIHRSKFTKQ
jgi:hypothetical protein